MPKLDICLSAPIYSAISARQLAVSNCAHSHLPHNIQSLIWIFFSISMWRFSCSLSGHIGPPNYVDYWALRTWRLAKALAEVQSGSCFVWSCEQLWIKLPHVQGRNETRADYCLICYWIWGILVLAPWYFCLLRFWLRVKMQCFFWSDSVSEFLNLINEYKVDAWYLPFSCSTVNVSLCRVDVWPLRRTTIH